MEHLVLGYDGSAASASALEWVARRVEGRRAGTDVQRVARGGTPARGTRDADLLVLGAPPGPRAQAVLQEWATVRAGMRSHVPVVLVPEGWGPIAGPVTVGVDEDSSAGALAFAATEAVSESVALRLVHCWLMTTPDPRTPAVSPVDSAGVAEQHRRLLDAAGARVRASYPGLPVSTEIVRDNPAAALASFASDSSMLVIGAHRPSVSARGVLGTVGGALIGVVDRPICIVPLAAVRG